MSEIRVVVADDHPLYREGMVTAVRGAPDLEIAAACGDGAAAYAAIVEHAPEVALLDLRMPKMAAIDVCRALAADGHSTRVLVISATVDGSAVVQALEVGAAGYIAKDAARDEICDAIRAVAGGRSYVDPRIQTALTDELQGRHRRATGALTERELEILTLLSQGLTAPAIAERLVIGTATVKTHLSNLYEKLGVSDRAAAVGEGMRRGLVI